MDDQPQHLTTTEARAGTGTDVNRYPLYFGLALVVAIFALLLFVYA